VVFKLKDVAGRGVVRATHSKRIIGRRVLVVGDSHNFAGLLRLNCRYVSVNQKVAGKQESDDRENCFGVEVWLHAPKGITASTPPVGLIGDGLLTQGCWPPVRCSMPGKHISKRTLE